MLPHKRVTTPIYPSIREFQALSHLVEAKVKVASTFTFSPRSLQDICHMQLMRAAWKDSAMRQKHRSQFYVPEAEATDGGLSALLSQDKAIVRKFLLSVIENWPVGNPLKTRILRFWLDLRKERLKSSGLGITPILLYEPAPESTDADEILE